MWPGNHAAQWGIDFLGYVVFLLHHHRLLRTVTRRRMVRTLRARSEECRRGQRSRESAERSLWSYLGVLSHADTDRLRQQGRNRWLVWVEESAVPAREAEGES